jgi:hypothetical protein
MYNERCDEGSPRGMKLVVSLPYYLYLRTPVDGRADPVLERQRTAAWVFVWGRR